MAATVTCSKILDSSPYGVIATDVSGNIIFANKYAGTLLGKSPHTLVSTKIANVLPACEAMVSECIQTGSAKLRQHLSGKFDNLLLDIIPLSENGIILGSVCSFQEIQKIEEIAKEFEPYKELHNQLEIIFSSSSDGIYLVDGQGKLLKMNRASEKINGINAEDFIGKSVTHLLKTEMVDCVVSIEVLKTKQQVSVMQYNRRADKHLLLTGTPVFDENENISFVVVNERDITELNMLRTQLERSRQVTEKYRDELSSLSLQELNQQEILSSSREFQDVLTVALKLAHLGVSNMLILGESGTGKGLISKFIHKNSKRRDKPLIHINCAAIPESLLEAELFGYEKGAFTGARDKGKIGLFELAEGGTLFLDEIGELPLTTQSKLLKYLEDHEVRRLGGTKSYKVDCTIIAATNRNLEKLIQEKKFRQDLFYRLNAFTINIPPLRERPEDILELANHFLSKYNKRYEQDLRLSPEMLTVLQSCPLQGNVRELKNFIKKAVVIGEKAVLDELCKGSNYVIEKWSGPGNKNQRILSLSEEVGAVEREILRIAMTRCRTTREMAKYLRVSQPTVIRKMRKHNLT